YSACGSPLLAALVGSAAVVIGKLVERELNAEPTPSPDPAVEPDIIDVVFEVLPEVEPITGPTIADDEPRAESRPAAPVDPQLAAAAALLGVTIDASADEIRAALRAALSSSRLHPDHGGDGAMGKRLI